MLSNLANSPDGRAWQVGNKSALKTAHQKQKTRHKDGCARMVARNSFRASSAFQASHLARKQVGTANTVLNDR
ncbi:MAG: hypothetical protein EBS54_02180 [Betaproteobacteria bacterium]|nr:hypothetical protein [Betaproteobacteria bacterium]NCV15770.1 hypothetical protein [Betaproteobacteria bacterium]NDC03909.1 hypothetical protein [Betaproteobacteria bacterium]